MLFRVTLEALVEKGHLVCLEHVEILVFLEHREETGQLDHRDCKEIVEMEALLENQGALDLLDLLGLLEDLVNKAGRYTFRV